jgi:O-antigen/teichoic acid export membrane protein
LEKALKMGKDSATGSFQLFIAKIVSTFILAISTIIVGTFINDVDYGLYVVALIPITTFLLFQDWGVGAALTKYSANYRHTREEENLRKIIISGLTFEVATGLALTVLSLVLASLLATTILGHPESGFLISIGSISILFTGLYAVSQAIFVGFERMRLTGFTMVLQAAMYCALTPLLVYLGYGAFGAMIGFTFSYVVAGIISIALLYFSILRNLSPCKINKFEITNNLKTLLNFGVPVAIALLVSGVLMQFYSFMMAHYCDVAIIGHYKVALNFSVFISFFTFPISTVLFPAFSKLDSRNEQSVLKTIFSSAIKYTALFAIPATIAMMVMSAPIISTLYGNKWIYSPFFLSLELIQYLFIAIGGLTNGTFLQGVGETKTLLKLRLFTLCVGIPLAFLLIPMLQIVGVIFTTVIASMPSIFIGIYWIWKHYNISVDFKSSAKIFIASAIAGMTTYTFLTLFSASAWIMLTIGAILFIFIYLIAAPLVRAVNQDDINNLRVMFSGLGIVSKILEIPLRIVEKPLKINLKRKNNIHYSGRK